MKKCPFCAEEIQDAAIVCRYCGRDLPPTNPPSEQPPAVNEQPIAASKEPNKVPKIYINLAVIFLVLIAVGLGAVALNNPRVTKASSTAQPTSVSVSDASEDVLKPNYNLIDKVIGTSATECILDVRLPDRITENELRTLATYLRAHEGTNCSPLYIYYFLSGDQVGKDMAWAYSHFNPQLEVKINGLDLQTKATLEVNKPSSDSNTVGTWLDTGALPHTIIIKKMGSSYQMTSTYSDGSGETVPLVVMLVDGEKRLYEDPDNYYGDYMVIKANGNLAFYDSAGFIYELSAE